MKRRESGNQFPTTRWSLLARIRSGNEKDSAEALEIVCSRYWVPLYHYLRMLGDPPEQAEDCVQGFFAELLSHEGLSGVSGANEQVGRLRSYLLTSLKNFRIDQYRRSNAQKRGARFEHISADLAFDESHASALRSPERGYDEFWARNLMHNAGDRLREEYEKRGKLTHFLLMEPFLEEKGPVDVSYASIASKLNISLSLVKMSVFRLRKRMREIVKEEVALTLGEGSKVTVEEEMESLFSILRKN